MRGGGGYQWALSSLIVALSIDRAAIFQFDDGHTGGRFIAWSGAYVDDPGEVVWGYPWSKGEILPTVLDGMGAESYHYHLIVVEGLVWGAVALYVLEGDREWGEDVRARLQVFSTYLGKGLLTAALAENVALQCHVRRERLLLQRVIDSIPVYLGIKNIGGQFVLVNKALAEAAGYGSPELMVGHEEWGDYFPPDSEEQEARVLNTGERYASLSSKGRDRWFTVMRVYIPADSMLEAMVISTLVDITDMRLLTKRLEDFTHIASHDLQEPLRTISSFLGLLKKRHASELSGKALSHVDTAIDASVRMGELLKDLLVYSRLGAKPKPLSTVSLSQVLMKAMKNVSGKLMQEAACPTMMYDPSTFPDVWGDEVQLVASIQNLLSNAIKFGGGSPIEISCRVGTTHWEVLVVDYGIGVPEGMEEAIFSPFKRAHSAYEGTGMGLAIVKKVAHLHQGDAWATKTPGGGTTMHLSIKRP